MAAHKDNSIIPFDKEADILEWELERRREKERLRFFVPNGAQEEFLREFGKEGIRTVIFAAANGVGKTAIGIVALGACIWSKLAEHESLRDSEVYTSWSALRFVKRARIISTSKEIEETGSIQDEIRKWWPEGRYSGEKCGKPYISKYKTDTGWLIDLMTLDQEKEQFEGATVSFFIFNEPPSREIYNASALRMRFGGKVVIVMTPLYAAAWIKDELVDKADKNRTSVIYADIEKNCKIHGKNGVLEHDKIEEMLAACDPDELEARAHGRFMSLDSVIFSEFDRKAHVAKEPIIPPRSVSLEHIQIIDPHAGKPFAIIWAYADPFGFLYVYDEWPHFDFMTAKESKFTVDDYVKLCRSEEKYRIDTRILDRHYGNNRDLQTGQTLRDDFADRGIICMDSYSCDEEVETGILKVKSYLSYDRTRPVDTVNRPRMLISPTCRNLIRSMERWARNKNTGKPNNDCWKDFCDDARYLCMYQPLPHDYSSRRQKTAAVGSGVRENWDTSQPFR